MQNLPQSALDENPGKRHPPEAPLKLAVTIDVEEEGLFSGAYASSDVSVSNVAYLELLRSLFSDLGIRPTLLVTYRVAEQRKVWETLHKFSDELKGEIGAHLHHWNTPPFEPLPYRDPVPSELMTVELLTRKFDTLIEALDCMGVVPRSFRMGRYNLGPRMFSVLRNSGIEVDGSIAPMMRFYGGPDHLAAAPDPYFPDPQDPCKPGNCNILEVPVTILSLVPGLGEFLTRINRNASRPVLWISWLIQEIGRLSAQPMHMGLARLKATVKLHRRRGGRVVTLAFHSSELMPGGCPQHKTMADVKVFIRKLERFLAWLRIELEAHSVTLSDLRSSIPHVQKDSES